MKDLLETNALWILRIGDWLVFEELQQSYSADMSGSTRIVADESKEKAQLYPVIVQVTMASPL